MSGAIKYQTVGGTSHAVSIWEIPVADLEWQGSALCAQADPEEWFPEKGNSTRTAKRVCGGCTVRAQCLQAALDRDERFGVWGGLSERERRRLKKDAA